MWCHFLDGPGAVDLYHSLTRSLLGTFVPARMDVIIECRTREGGRVRCVASYTSRMMVEGGKSFAVLRLLPCLSRSFGPALAEGGEGGREGGGGGGGGEGGGGGGGGEGGGVGEEEEGEEEGGGKESRGGV